MISPYEHEPRRLNFLNRQVECFIAHNSSAFQLQVLAGVVAILTEHQILQLDIEIRWTTMSERLAPIDRLLSFDNSSLNFW
jgi:hypothetical protein